MLVIQNIIQLAIVVCSVPDEYLKATGCMHSSHREGGGEQKGPTAHFFYHGATYEVNTALEGHATIEPDKN